jgi:hypothetical protein
MMTGPWLVLGVTVIVAVLIGVLVLYAPSLRTFGQRSTGGTGAPRWRPEASPPGSLLKGVGYLFGSRRTFRRSHGVTGRFERAVGRIDKVDPFAAPRRIGLAMVQAGLVDEPSLADRPTEERSADE